MHRRAAQIVAVVILLVCLGSHVSELFDTWDQTLQTGNDVESVVVVLALATGAVLVGARLTASYLRPYSSTLRFACAIAIASPHALPICSDSSSPPALRI